MGIDGTIYIGSDDHNVYAVTASGTLKWAFPTGDRVQSSAAIGADGTIYIGSNDRNLYAITDNGTSATQKWAFASGGGVFSSPAIGRDGAIFVGSENANVYALIDNVNRPTERWVFGTGFMVLSSPAIAADGTVYVGSADDNLYAVGISSPPVAIKLRVRPKSLNFGIVRAGKVAGPRYVNIVNPKFGKKNREGLTVTMQGQRLNPAFIPFTVVNGCSPSLLAGERCYVFILFAPSVAGPQKGNLMIFDNAEPEPQLVKLKGTGK